MIKYSCEVSLSLDKACEKLNKLRIPHKVISETTLGFRKRPTRNAKKIMTSCGFVRENTDG